MTSCWQSGRPWTLSTTEDAICLLPPKKSEFKAVKAILTRLTSASLHWILRFTALQTLPDTASGERRVGKGKMSLRRPSPGKGVWKTALPPVLVIATSRKHKNQGATETVKERLPPTTLPRTHFRIHFPLHGLLDCRDWGDHLCHDHVLWPLLTFYAPSWSESRLEASWKHVQSIGELQSPPHACNGFPSNSQTLHTRERQDYDAKCVVADSHIQDLRKHLILVNCPASGGNAALLHPC